MARHEFARGYAELKAARADQTPVLVAVMVFSTLVNLLMLTGPLYMLQVYDRVLGSQSVPTLVALTGLITFLFVAMGFLDHARGRIMARIGAKIQERMDRRVFQASVRRMTVNPGDQTALAAQRDLEAIQRLWASPVLMAIFDIPWTPLFIGAIFIFHPWMGWLSIAGGVLLVMVTWLNQRMTEQPLNRTNNLAMQAERYADNLKAESEVIQALGMQSAGFDRWQRARGTALAQAIQASDLGGVFGSITKTFRLFLQSLMLGLGAWLVLRGELSAGAMIAGSILMGRALAPIEQSIGQWAVVTRAREARDRLAELLSRTPVEPDRTQLPRPRAILEAQNLTVVPPGARRRSACAPASTCPTPTAR
jgi:ATP-binding cassette, subfamily C, bacterial